MAELRGLVVYDSVYGNTEEVAKAIADEVKTLGHQVELWVLRERGIPKEVDADFLFIGSPTRMHNMTRRAKKFVNGLDPKALGSRPIGLFDTEGEDVIAKSGPSAAERMRDIGKLRGLNVRDAVLKCGVVGPKGPLSPDAIDKARRFAKEFVSGLG